MAVSKPLIRFSLFQLISFAVAIAALGSWLLQDKTRNIVWLTGTLKYHVPATPDNYKKPVDSRWFGKAKPVIQILPNAELKNGEHLFRQAHEAGWQACRYHFHSNFEANIKYQIQGKYEDIELVGDDNIQSAAVLAYAHGYNNCQKQIDHLLQQQTPDALRRSIAVRKSPSVPILVLGILSSVFFLFSFTKRSPTPRQFPEVN